MPLQISGPILTHCMMRGIEVGAFRRGTGNKSPYLVAGSQSPKTHYSGTILPRLHFLLENKLSSISTVCPGPPIWTGLFKKCETAMSLWNAPTIIFRVNYGMLIPDLQFMLGVYHGHFPWLFNVSAPQIGKGKYFPHLQMQFFKKATVSDAYSLLTNLSWKTPGNAISCTIQDLLPTLAIASWANHLRS